MAKTQRSGSAIRSRGSRPTTNDGDPSARLRAVAACENAATVAQFLRDSSPDVARAAIRRLVQIEGAGAAQALRSVLVDADISIVADLARALRAMDDREAIDLTLSALTDEQYTRRLRAAIALGILGDPGTRPGLCAALDDSVAAVRAAALEALARLGPDRQAAESAAGLLQDRSPQARMAAVRVVAAAHPRSSELLSAAAGDRDAQVRRVVAGRLGKLDDEAVRDLLADRDEGVRSQATQGARSEHVPLLARLIVNDSRPQVRRAAARALGAVGGQAAAEALIPGIEDRDALVRSAVMHALERALTHGGAIMRLTGEMNSARAQRRRSSLYALAKLGDRDRVTQVWRLADDPDLDVRLAVVDTATILLSQPEPLLMYMSTDANSEVRASAEQRLTRCQA